MPTTSTNSKYKANKKTFTNQHHEVDIANETLQQEPIAAQATLELIDDTNEFFIPVPPPRPPVEAGPVATTSKAQPTLVELPKLNLLAEPCISIVEQVFYNAGVEPTLKHDSLRQISEISGKIGGSEVIVKPHGAIIKVPVTTDAIKQTVAMINDAYDAHAKTIELDAEKRKEMKENREVRIAGKDLKTTQALQKEFEKLGWKKFKICGLSELEQALADKVSNPSETQTSSNRPGGR